jgi:hypothetical protein
MMKKNKEWHEYQMSHVKEALDVLNRIDYSTDTRYIRSVGISNAYGLKWIMEDVLSTFRSMFFDGQYEFSPSLKRTMEQALTATVTVFEVAMKWVTTFFDEVYSIYTCFEASPLTCVVSKLLKYVGIAIVAAFGFVILGNTGLIGKVLLDIITSMASAIIGAAKTIYGVGAWLVGGALGEAMKNVSTFGKRIGDLMLGWASDTFPNVLSFFQTITSCLWGITGTLKGAWNVIHSISTMEGPIAPLKRWMGWSMVGNELMGPTFKQFLVADNFALQKFVLKDVSRSNDFRFVRKETKEVEETPEVESCFKQLKF